MRLAHKRGCGVESGADSRVVLVESPDGVFRRFCTVCNAYGSPFEARDRIEAIKRSAAHSAR